jgi:hypothetical protein
VVASKISKHPVYNNNEAHENPMKHIQNNEAHENPRCALHRYSMEDVIS